MDRRIKGNLMTDIFHMVGVVPTDRKKLKEKQADRKQDRLLYGNQAGLKRRSLAELRETPLHQLPDDDLEIIMESEDEFRRRGNFNRVYPCKVSAQLPLDDLHSLAHVRSNRRMSSTIRSSLHRRATTTSFLRSGW